MMASMIKRWMRSTTPFPVREVRTTCGNPDHPAGQWHLSSSLAASWEWAERYRQWRRKRAWGCRCASVWPPY